MTRDEYTTDKILDAMVDAERKAWEALSGYKFWMFGYHAGRWVNYNNLLSSKLPNPFKDAVILARNKVDNLPLNREQTLFPTNGEAGARSGRGDR